MPTAVVNNTAAKIAVVSRFVADSTGKTYAGTNKFEIPANGRKNIPSPSAVSVTKMTNPFKKQSILINTLETTLLCESRLSAGAAGVTYSGIASYILPANSHKVIPYDVFTKESVYLLKSLQIHATAAGMNPKILDIGEIEENEAIIFFAQINGSIGARFIPRDENERGLPYYLRGLTTFWRRGDDSAALLDLHV